MEQDGEGLAWLGVVQAQLLGTCGVERGWEPANEEGTWLCRASCSVLLPREQRLPGTSAVAMETTEVPTC